MGRKVPFPQSKEEAGVLRSELAVRAYARVPAARFTGGATWNEFISLDFTHHMEILSKTKDISERFFYIHECADTE